MRNCVHARLLAGIGLAFLGIGVAAGAATGTAATATLNALLAEQWDDTMQHSPETATMLGDYRYNDQWSDFSVRAAKDARRRAAEFLRRFEAIPAAELSEGDRLNRQLMIEQLRDEIEAADLKLYEMPVDQFTGVQIELAGAVSSMPFDSVRHYEDYLARLNAIPKLFADVTATLRAGRADRLMPPRYLLEKAAEQCRSLAAPAGVDNAFGAPLKAFPDSVPAADRERLRRQILAAIDQKVRPAYTRLGHYIEAEYAPYGRETPGLWALPNGDRIYEYYVRHHTTTAMKPQAIHELGLAEVERIEAEMTGIAHKLGFTDLASLRRSFDHDPELHGKSREQILDAYRGYIDAMQARLPQIFGLLPKSPVEVRPVQEYREKEAAGAEYAPGPVDGSRPGIVFVNTGDFANRETLTIEATAYHEGVPGHHMQIAIAQTLPDLPPFRQNAGYNAYEEGWALYAERLGKDVGFYQDPHSDYGRLVSELLRADRLVLDTGVHYKHWTREQMVKFFREHAAGDEPTIQSETDRYIVMPGQALSYKIGQLKFLELRDRARRALGDKFDLRAFHDQMLGGGALPLDVLESRFSEWLARQPR